MVASLGSLELWVRLASNDTTTVYLAREPVSETSGRMVVVKLLNPSVTGADADRFRDAVRVVSRLSHPNLVCVTGHGEIDGISAMAMEYVLGFDLETTLTASVSAGAALPPEIVLRIVAAVCRGLHFAHELRDEQGRPTHLVHRDIGAGNVLVAFSGEAKLTDFDLVYSDDRRTRTDPGTHVQGIRTLAPEQFESRAVDRRVDVFGVGRMLWESLVGRPLFGGGSIAELHRAIAIDPITPPSQACGSVPAGVDHLVLRALERDPERRCASAGELADEIDDLLRKSRRTTDASDVAVSLAGAFGERIPRLARALRAAMAGRGGDTELAELCGGATVAADEIERMRPTPGVAAFYDDDAEATMRAPPPPPPARVVVYEDPPTVYASPAPPSRPAAAPPEAAPAPPVAAPDGRGPAWNLTAVRTLSADDLSAILEPTPTPEVPRSPNARRVRPADQPPTKPVPARRLAAPVRRPPRSR